MARKIIKNEGRDNLAALFKGVGVEVGVERGHFSKRICALNPDTTLYAVDSWKAYKGYRDHVSQDKLDNFFAETGARLAPFNCILVRKESGEAAHDFPDGSLDFVYIDANHAYEWVLRDIRLWAPKVRPGGIVAGHDYIRRKGQDHLYGVVPAVDEYLKEANIEEFFIYKADKSPSWMFIRQ